MGGVLNTVGTDVLVLKHQAITTLSAYKNVIVLDLFQAKGIYYEHHSKSTLKNK